MRFEFLNQEHYGEIEHLTTIAEVDYPINYDCKFLGARNGSAKLLGFVAYSTKEKYPQIWHLVLRPDVPRRIGIKLINKMEQAFRNEGYREYVAYVENTRNQIQLYAMRINFKPYSSDSEGVWFVRCLRK